MDFGLSPRVRKVIYVLATILTPTMLYLNQEGVIDAFWYGLYIVIATAVTGLAALNTKGSQ